MYFNYGKGKTRGNPGETYSPGSPACAPWCPTRRSPSSVFRAPSCCSYNRRRRCTTGIPVGKRHGNLGDSVCIIYDSLLFYRGRNCGRRRWRGHVRCTSLCLCGEFMRKPQGNTYIFSLPLPQPSLPPPLPWPGASWEAWPPKPAHNKNCLGESSGNPWGSLTVAEVDVEGKAAAMATASWAVVAPPSSSSSSAVFPRVFLCFLAGGLGP